MAQQLMNPPRSTRMQVRSLTSLNKDLACRELWCRSQTRLGSPVAVAVV